MLFSMLVLLNAMSIMYKTSFSIVQCCSKHFFQHRKGNHSAYLASALLRDCHICNLSLVDLFLDESPRKKIGGVRSVN